MTRCRNEISRTAARKGLHNHFDNGVWAHICDKAWNSFDTPGQDVTGTYTTELWNDRLDRHHLTTFGSLKEGGCLVTVL